MNYDDTWGVWTSINCYHSSQPFHYSPDHQHDIPQSQTATEGCDATCGAIMAPGRLRMAIWLILKKLVPTQKYISHFRSPSGHHPKYIWFQSFPSSNPLKNKRFQISCHWNHRYIIDLSCYMHSWLDAGQLPAQLDQLEGIVHGCVRLEIWQVHIRSCRDNVVDNPLVSQKWGSSWLSSLSQSFQS